MGFRRIQRVKGVHHTTVITWVKQVGELNAGCLHPISKIIKYPIRVN